MRAFAILSLLSLAAALPASVSPITESESLNIVEREVGSVAVRASSEQSSQDASVLVARALYDRTTEWPATSVDFTTISFQVTATNLNNGKYRLDWWNTDPANSRRDIKLTVNSGSGARLYDLVTSPRTRGSVEISKATSSFRVIFDEQ
ncbi:hypothetical protein CT0861_02430 [Colletotrichum tofieldiae]|uniref:Uncharacterized protein n=1 Tax=Colletotrichum tofieldiae TaxID=708197 RepID=A0A166Y7W7_9PEZI|nr:hypothetical protein CT0861_02430 [Colletotrichum tofieldiae]GKT84472.1 hypothetical protein Ct61P_02322 [Colletotrichum tofieldiae]